MTEGKQDPFEQPMGEVKPAGEPVDLAARISISRKKLRKMRFNDEMFAALPVMFSTDLIMEAMVATAGPGAQGEELTDAAILAVAINRCAPEILEQIKRIAKEGL